MKKILFFAVSALAVLASCSREERIAITSEDNLQVKFTPAVGSYSVKAGDTSFDNGDVIGITALNPINADNVKYIYRDGALVPENEGISWLPNQKTTSLFFAVYPYRENFHMYNDGTFGDSEEYPNGVLITVESDQSTYEKYSMSNQLLCSAQAAPGEEVKLSFYHAVSKVVIKVENHLSVPVVEAYLAGVYGSYLRYANKFVGNAGTIKANPDGENQWKLVVVPQGAYPTLVLKTADGAEYAYDCPNSGVYFNQGYQTTLSVVLDENTTSTFVSEIRDWSEDREYVFDNEAYMKKLRLATLFEEICGDYEASSSAGEPADPWTLTLVQSGSRVGFMNIFANAAWSAEDTMYYGDITDDLTGIHIPFAQESQYLYNGTPLTLYGIDAAFEDLFDTPGVTATIVRDASGVVTGLDFGEEYGFIAYIIGAGYVGYCKPHVTAVKK